MGEHLPPEPPPQPPWWEDPWPALLAGLLGLIAGGLVGFAIGQRGQTTTEAQGGGAPALAPVTRTTTVVRPKIVVQTKTVTATATQQTAAPLNSANERRRAEAEENLRAVERENEELKRRLEEG